MYITTISVKELRSLDVCDESIENFLMCFGGEKVKLTRGNIDKFKRMFGLLELKDNLTAYLRDLCRKKIHYKEAKQISNILRNYIASKYSCWGTGYMFCELDGLIDTIITNCCPPDRFHILVKDMKRAIKFYLDK